MKHRVLVTAFLLALSAASAAQAMQTVPYLGPRPDAEPNRLTTAPSSRDVDPYARRNSVAPYLSLTPNDLQAPRAEERRGPGFLNADPFDPNSVVNSYERSLFANPYPYDPIYNPYGQGGSNYAPGGGGRVPMGNGIRYGR